MGYLDLFNLYATNAVFKEWIVHNTYWQKVEFFIKNFFSNLTTKNAENLERIKAGIR